MADSKLRRLLSAVELDHSIKPGTWNDSPWHEQARSEFRQRARWKAPEVSAEEVAAWLDEKTGRVAA